MFRTDTSLRRRILRICIIGTLFTLFLQTVLFTYYSVQIFSEQSKTQNDNALNNMQSEIYNHIKGIEADMIATYNDESLIRDLENGLGIDMLRDKYYDEASILQNENFQNSDSVVAFYLYDKKDELISSYQKSMTQKYKYPKDIFDADYEVNSKIVLDYVDSDETTMLISSYYNHDRQDSIVRYVIKLYKNSDTSRVIGFAVCDVNKTGLLNIIKKYMTTDDLIIWLQPTGDRQTVMCGSITGLNMTEYKQLLAKISYKNDNIKKKDGITGYDFHQKEQTKYNLNAYMLSPQKAVNESLKVMLKVLAIIAVIMVFVALFMSYRISTSISQPLENIISIINRIKNGEENLRIGNQDRTDEIGTLGRNFNEMLDEVHELSAEKYKTKMLLERAEYLTLQAQINPHFLYNTLDTMSSIASLQNCQTVSYLSQSLANIFRYTLNMSNPLATVSEEMSHVRNYIYVMDVRNRSAVSYEFHLDKETFTDILPRVSIEPIVENALSHGLKNSRRTDKKVVITSGHRDGLLYVMVSDNGIGTDTDEINRRMNDEQFMLGEKGHSIGLTNINNRLKRLFGREYGLIFESSPDEGTTVTIRVPVMKQGEAAEWLKEHTEF